MSWSEQKRKGYLGGYEKKRSNEEGCSGTLQRRTAGKLGAGHAFATSILLTVGFFLAELEFPFRAVSRAQAGLFRKPGRCSEGLTRCQCSCSTVQALAGGEREQTCSWHHFPASWDALSFCLLAIDEPRVDTLLLVSGPLNTLFTGSQGAINEATRQRVTVGTYPALSGQMQE